MNLSDDDARRLLRGMELDEMMRRLKNSFALLQHQYGADICRVWSSDTHIYSQFVRGRTPGNDGMIATLPDVWVGGGGADWLKI